MKGYGLSVFSGTKIERFGVEVLSVLKNFNPKHDVILVRLSGVNLEHTGTIEGMSGSPVFLKDDKGHERMVGAFAYGWPLAKDPIGGVQPIEYMLAIPKPRDRNPATGLQDSAATTDPTGATKQATPRMSWSLSDAVMLPGMQTPPRRWPFASRDIRRINPQLGNDDGDAMRLRPLATPLMTSGLSPALLEEFGPLLKAYGLVPLQAGGIAGAADAHAIANADTTVKPGSVLGIPLLTGDVELAAVGTATEVIGDRVVAFGHYFNNEGPIALPMGAGYINGIVANLQSSFKLGALTKVVGTLYNDQLVGVAGELGAKPAMIPIDLQIDYADGSMTQAYHFQCAMHPQLTPALAAMAVDAAINGARQLPQYHTLDYDLNLEFLNGQTLRIHNTSVNATAYDLFYEIGMPIIAAATNPFERVMPKKITGTVLVTPEAREATILSVNIPKSKYRPGETVRGYISYRPFRSGEAVMPIELTLPRDLADGKYQLMVSDWRTYLETEQQAEPFRFMAESEKDVFGVLKDLAAVRHNAVYLRLLRHPDGVAIGRTAMERLPSSRRQVMLDAGRSNTTPFLSSTINVIPTKLVMNGVSQFEITIDKDARVEVGGAKANRGENATPPASTPDAGDRKGALPPTQNQPERPTNPGSPTPGEAGCDGASSN